jgi:putative NADH-flavin reductase
MSNIIIFGSTGTVGLHLVEQSLDLGHAVTAFTRSPAKLRIVHPSLKIIKADVLDASAVLNAVRGHEAVLVALGAGRDGNVRSAGTKNIVQAMETAKVNRLICETTLGAGDSRGNLNFFWKYIMFGMLLKDAYQDHERQETVIRSSNLQWTIVRPAAFTDGPLTGVYKHGFSALDQSIKLKIGRADVANFMLRQLTDDDYVHKTPGLSY